MAGFFAIAHVLIAFLIPMFTEAQVPTQLSQGVSGISGMEWWNGLL